MSDTSLVAGVEMDQLIAERLFGWQWVEMPAETRNLLESNGHAVAVADSRRLRPAGSSYWGPPQETLPPYSTDIVAAWVVAERVIADETERTDDNLEFLLFLYSTNPAELWACKVFHPGEGDGFGRCATAPTAPLAVCRAALLALPQ